MSTIRTIKQVDLDNLGIDEGNNLYWQGRPVVLERRIALPWFVNFFAIVGGLATATIAVIEVLQYFGI